MVLFYLLGFAVVYIISSIKIIFTFERGVRFFLGKYEGIMEPGLKFIFKPFHTWERVDMRTNVIDVPDQDCITKDNVSVKVNAVLYYKVLAANKAIIKVENYQWATSQIAQTTLRDVVGEASLDELLSGREKISERIQQLVDTATDPWGIKVESVDLKHIELPESLTRTMAKEAEAERERRAVVIKAQGEVEASDNVSEAARILSSSDGAMHLRTLQSLNDMSSDQSNTIVFAVPLEVVNAMDSAKGKWKK